MTARIAQELREIVNLLQQEGSVGPDRISRALGISGVKRVRCMQVLMESGIVQHAQITRIKKATTVKLNSCNYELTLPYKLKLIQFEPERLAEKVRL